VIQDSGEKNPLRGFSKKNRVECTVGFFLLYKHRTEKECGGKRCFKHWTLLKRAHTAFYIAKRTEN
jgi:hypothetical protein